MSEPRVALARSESDSAGRLLYALAREDHGALAAVDLARDWPTLLPLAQREQALVALRNFCSRNPTLVRPEWGHRLALLVLDSQRRMFLIRRRLEETLVALNDAQVTPILLKGAALATTVYDSWDRRSMRDVDILVHPDDLETTRDAATAAGWIADSSLPGDSAYDAHHHMPPLLDAKGSGTRLEIHRSLLPEGHPFAIGSVELLRACHFVTIGDGRARVMDPHHHAVHIAIHFVWSHEMRSAAWNAFRDLDTLLRRGIIDWNELVRIASDWKARSCLYWTLRLGSRLSGLPVPESVLDELRPLAAGPVLDRLEQHFVQALLQLETARLPTLLERTLWNAAIQPRQQGHGDSRPWTVSTDLLLARLEQYVDDGSGDGNLGVITQLKQSVLYLSKLGRGR